jgi:hypothetical protein
VATATSARRAGGTNLRAAGANPRAEAERTEEARLRAEALDRQRRLEAQTEARRHADQRAVLEADRLEAEALALSGAVDDAVLAGVVAHVTAGMSGLLAGSTMAVARAVVAWCRAAADAPPGPLAAAIAAGLAADLVAGETHPPLRLPAAASDTTPLRTRITGLLKHREVS